MTNRTVIIVLAAGASTRMGRSKQLLEIGNTKLLTHTVSETVKSKANEVWVVLGDQAKAHKKVIAHLKVNIVINTNWAAGMGSSLKIGLKEALEQSPMPDAVIITVCDQPLLTAKIFDQLIEKFQKGAKVVACSYANATGVPVLFSASFFEELLLIADHEGAKKLISQAHGLHTIEFHGGEFDLDTPEDYDSFIRQSHTP